MKAMKTVNIRLLLLLVAVVVGGIVGVFLLHRYQVNRNAGSLAKLARLRLSEGKKDEALMLFARYVNFRPEDDEAYGEFARLVLERAESPMANRGDISRAYSVLETAVRKNPADDDLRRRLAAFEMKIGRFVDARQHLQTLRERLPAESPSATKPAADAPKAEGARPLDRTEIELLLARAHAGTGNFDEAAAIASGLIGFDLAKKSFDPKKKSAPDNTEAFILLAAILEEKFKDPATANALLEQLVKANAADPKAWLALSSWHRQRGDLAAAKKDVAQAEAIAPKDINVILAAFELALIDKNLARAGETIRRGLEIAPDDERIVRGRAVLAMQEQAPEKAIEILEEALDATPGQPTLLLMLGDAQLQANRLPALDVTIAKLKETIGKSSPAVGLLESRSLVAQGKWLQAKSRLESLRPLVAGSDELTRQVDLYLGQCYERLGQFDEQLEANRRVLTDDPTSLAARVGAASALLAAGKSDEAIEEFELVARAIPKDRLPAIPQLWSPLLQLRVAAQMKRPVADRDWSSVDELLDLLQQSPGISSTQMALLRADILVRKGEVEAAADLLDDATKADPKEPQLWAGLATLELQGQGPTQARAVLARVPPAIADAPNILLIAAQIAAREPAETAAKELAAIEARAQKLPPDDSARILSALASIQLGLGKADEAERLWKAVAEKAPDDLRVRTALYELAREQGNAEKAKARADDLALVAGPTSPQARLAQAGTLILGVRESQKKKTSAGDASIELDAAERRDLDQARNLLIEAENDRPGWHQIQQLFAEIDGLRGDMPAAIEHLQRAVRMGPANPAVVRQLVALLYASNRVDEAQQALARLGPDGLEGFERITAEMEMRSGKFDDAVALAERSVSKDSKNPRDLLWLGQLLSRSGKADRASDVLQRAVEAAPEQPETWLTLFSHQLASGERKPAENTLDRAADRLPEPARQLVLAQGYEMLGRFPDAEREYREAVTASPGDLSASRSLAAFLVRRGRLNPAREELRGIIDAKADDSSSRGIQRWARRTLAQLTAESGGYRALEQAVALVEKNVGSDGKLSPDDVSLLVSMLAVRPEPASWRRAAKLLETLAASQPLSAAQRLQLAQLRERAGRWEECRSDLVSLVAAPNTPPALYALLVEKLIEHGELSSARTWLTKLRSLAPDAPVTLALEAKLAMAEDDRPTAVAAARKLMPSGPVPLEQVGQLRDVARLMEDLEFPKAADKILTEYAGRSVDGIVARAEFLGRQKRTGEALDLLETAWNRLPLERVLQAGLTVIRGKGERPSPEMTARLDQWFKKALREDPDSVVIALLQAELRELQGRSDEVESLYRDLLARKDLAPTQAAIVANNLAFHLARPETAAEAITLIDSAIAELGPHPDLLDTRGVVRLAAGDARRAIADLEEATLSPSPLKLLHLALAQAEDKQTLAARRSLEQARKRGLDRALLTPADRARLERVEAAVGGKGA
jgi:tetratricopeptide (TPR) repeat protein